jgi:predicted anti-sigma-YlaC factor YlaD
MICPDDETLEGFADGELDEAEWAEVERHIDTCAACRERFEATRRADAKAREALTTLKSSAPPIALGLVSAKARRLSMPRAVAVAAAIALAIAAGGVWALVCWRPAQKQAAPPQMVATHTHPAPAKQIATENEPLMPVPILTADAIAAMGDPSTGDTEYRRRLASLRQMALMADTMPEWKAERLRRLLLYTRGIMPVNKG